MTSQRDFIEEIRTGFACLILSLKQHLIRKKTTCSDGGEAIRWILKDENGKTIGRIAAFFDRVRSYVYRQPTGGIGFFEVIENKDAAFTLFDTGKKWLSSHGMEAMDGPVNFGENDNNWGLLVDGFMQQGYGMPYHKKYYRDFFEAYGFRNYYEQYSYHREVRGERWKDCGISPQDNEDSRMAVKKTRIFISSL